MRPRTWRKVRRWGFISAAGIFAVVIIASLALSSVPGGQQSSGRGITDRVEYTLSQTTRDTGNPDHIAGGTRIIYEESPPNSGAHWGIWAQCGIYDQEINDEYVVHNLEHGQVVVSYNLPDPVERDRMLDVADSLSGLDDWGVVRPYSGIEEGTVVLTAWGVSSETIQGVDEAAIKDFYKDNIKNRNSAETAQFGPIACG